MRVRRLLFLLSASAVAVVAFACTAFQGDASTPPGGDAAASAPPDASADVATDGGAACENLLVNPGFEDQSRCAPWTNYGGSVGDGVPAHSGRNACLACTDAGGSVNLVAEILGEAFVPGDGLHVEVWVRPGDGGLLAQPARLYVETSTTNAGDPATATLGSDYRRIAAEYVIPPDGGHPLINVVVSDRADGYGGCILVDDVVACRSAPR